MSLNIEYKPYFKRLILAVVVVLSYWNFGQLYEAIVYSPNWIINPIEQIKILNNFYKVTSARNYFEPIVPLGVLLLWILFFLTKQREIKKRMWLPFVFSLLAMAINIFIVVALLLKIFSPNYWNDEAVLKELLLQWNVLNIFRIFFITLSLIHTFKLFLYLDRNKVEK